MDFLFTLLSGVAFLALPTFVGWAVWVCLLGALLYALFRWRIYQPIWKSREWGFFFAFLILLPNTKSSSAAEQAGRLSKQVRETIMDVNEQSLKVTISIGIAQFQTGVDTWETLLKRADNAMYEAKNYGRDRWVVAD